MKAIIEIKEINQPPEIEKKGVYLYNGDVLVYNAERRAYDTIRFDALKEYLDIKTLEWYKSMVEKAHKPQALLKENLIPQSFVIELVKTLTGK